MTATKPDPARQSVAVVGLGGIGGAAAGILKEAGRYEVTVCVRRPLERLIFERLGGTVELPLRALTDPGEAGPVDWVLLCTKAHETASAGPWLARLCAPETRVAVLQNGIDHAARVAPFIGAATAVPVIVYYNGERLAPDHVRFRSVSRHELVVPDDEGGRALAALLDGTLLRVLPAADFAIRAWRKLLLNAAANPITALTMQRQAVLRQPDVYALCLGVLEEGVRVARAAGVPLADNEAAERMETLMSFSPELGTSMYFDRQAGRPTEIEALNGAVVAAGERHGVATPLNRMLLALMRAVNDAAVAVARRMACRSGILLRNPQPWLPNRSSGLRVERGSRPRTAVSSRRTESGRRRPTEKETHEIVVRIAGGSRRLHHASWLRLHAGRARGQRHHQAHHL